MEPDLPHSDSEPPNTTTATSLGGETTPAFRRPKSAEHPKKAREGEAIVTGLFSVEESRHSIIPPVSRVTLLLMSGRKQATYGQVTRKQDKAVQFQRDVVGDDDKADDIRRHVRRRVRREKAH
jgi:hypothetical protein